MSGYVSAELLKLRTVRTLWLGSAVALGLTALFAVSLVGVKGLADVSVSAARDAVSSASIVSVVVLVTGITAMSGETRFGTIAATLLARPRREELVLAKAAAHAAFGLLLGAVAACFALGLVLVLVGPAGGGLPAGGDVAQVIAGVAADACLFGALGVGVGAVVRSQPVAIGAALLFLLMVDPVLSTLWAPFGTYGPNGASSALTGMPEEDGLAMGWAGLVLLGWTVAVVGAGIALLRRRDLS